MTNRTRITVKFNLLNLLLILWLIVGFSITLYFELFPNARYYVDGTKIIILDGSKERNMSLLATLFGALIILAIKVINNKLEIIFSLSDKTNFVITDTLIKLFLIFLFLSLLFNMPHDYYEVSRFLGMVCFGVIGYYSYKSKKEVFMVIWLASALLINPFIKLSIERTAWNYIDFVWIGLLIIDVVGVIKPKAKILNKNTVGEEKIDLEKNTKENKINSIKPTPTSPEKTPMGLLCEKLGIPYSLNTEQEGTASIRFMNKPKETKANNADNTQTEQ